MIDVSNFEKILQLCGFEKKNSLYIYDFEEIDAFLKVDFEEKKLIFPIEKGFQIHGEFTCSFKQKENFVVFLCVFNLFKKGYKPNHIQLEPKWTVGHNASGGRADIMVTNNDGDSLLIIECKTPGKEFNDAWKKTLLDGGQIFSYAKQAGTTEFISLYTIDYIDNNLVSDYYLITLKDNETLLNNLEKDQPLSYQKAKLLNKEDIHKAWVDTYAQDYSTKGIFESDIAPYDIGKNKYSIDDLMEINSSDIQSKYNKFATILRQHNVSGRENAFDKLVNLFLCKIVDETNSPNELKFYWKGVAYDSYFDLQDRLQKLYQDGMKKFLGEDVTYINNEAIDSAFQLFKNDPDATKTTIKKYFRELKFFTNNDFSFIDVHNENLFYQNSAILLKIVKLFQDIKLKTENQNQFLGDMFEGFLDQGVRQSEGQFFTPMPIVKFILRSLPIEEIILNESNEIKVIDYACGAGHFLNEFAQIIKPIVKENKDIPLESYYANIHGIEKEYRLSKVSKVSAFMYGQDDIQITYADALSQQKNIKNNEYTFLIANPPYSVKGFLETLKESDRKKFELINTISESSYSNNNTIETFFLERAKQLLKSEGIAAIIVPTSVLTKGKSKATAKTKNVYVATREMILKHFDIIALSSFGKGTFGKTGTTTVTLFLQRKKEDPSSSDHYKNRVNCWFKGDFSKDSIFDDHKFIKEYCNHIDIPYGDYKTLLESKPSDDLLSTSIFQEYTKAFLNSAEIKDRKKKPFFKKLSKDEQSADIQNRLISFIKECESEKLFYFILARLNSRNVVIVKSPSKTAEIKDFLGYEWSGKKGTEGIKYIGEYSDESTLDDDDGDGDSVEDDDQRVLSNIYNLDNINTPLYDPIDTYNPDKINFYILQNFNGEDLSIPEDLKDYITISPLIDMIDFRKIDFNKSISLTPSTTFNFNTNVKLNKLSSIASINPSKRELENIKDDSLISFVDMASVSEYGYITSIEAKKYEEVKSGGYTYFREGDILIAKITPCMENGKCALAINLPHKIGFGSSEFHVIRCNNPNDREYIFNLLNNPELRKTAEQNMTGSSGHRRVPEDFYSNLNIPIIENLDIKAEFIKDFNDLKSKLLESISKIQINQVKLDDLYSNIYKDARTSYKLSDTDIFEVSIGKRVLRRQLSKNNIGIPVYSANVFKPFGLINDTLLKTYLLPSVIWGIDGDWMVNLIPSNTPFYPTDHCGVIRIKSDLIDPKYFTWALLKEGQKINFSRSNRASMDSIKNLSIKVPPIDKITVINDQITAIENEILESQKFIKDYESFRSALFLKYLLDE